MFNYGFFETGNTEYLRTVFLWHSELLLQAMPLNMLEGLCCKKLSLLITLSTVTVYLLQTTGLLQDISETDVLLSPSYLHLRTAQFRSPHFCFLQLHSDILFPSAVCSSSTKDLYSYCECFLPLLKFPSPNHCMCVTEKFCYKYPFAIVLTLNPHVLDP